MKQMIKRVEKPWGYELIFAQTKDYVGKILFIKKGHQLSLQFHRIKEETIYVSSGVLKFQFEEEKGILRDIEMHPGDAHHIPPQHQHRMTALEDCTLFEVSTPHLDDVVRLQDSYGRANEA